MVAGKLPPGATSPRSLGTCHVEISGVALQLYTVRRSSPRRTSRSPLRRWARIGFTAVELAGYGEPEVGPGRCERSSTDAASGPSPVTRPWICWRRTPTGSWMTTTPWVTRTWSFHNLAEDRRETAAGWSARGRDAELQIARLVQPRDFQLAYHNHAFEFHPLPEGKRGSDILWENTDSGPYVRSELDTFWVKHGGEDPAALHPQAWAAGCCCCTPRTWPWAKNIALPPSGPGCSISPPSSGSVRRVKECNGPSWNRTPHTTRRRSMLPARKSLENLRKLGLTRTTAALGSTTVENSM